MKRNSALVLSLIGAVLFSSCVCHFNIKLPTGDTSILKTGFDYVDIDKDTSLIAVIKPYNGDSYWHLSHGKFTPKSYTAIDTISEGKDTTEVAYARVISRHRISN